MSDRLSFRDAVADYFRQHPNEWIDGDRFRSIGGKYAYRTRISDCRRELGMTIENRVRRVRSSPHLPGTYSISEYRFLPAEEPAVTFNQDGQGAFLL